MTHRWLLLTLLSGLALTAVPSGPVWAQALAPAPAPAQTPIPIPIPADEGPSARRIAASVQDFYDKTRVFKAGFKQRYWVKSGDTIKDSRGQVVFEKPGKMSWRYTSNGNRVVSDGKVVKIYEASNKQMYEQKVDKSQYPAALAFLIGGGNLLKSFRLRKLSSKRMQYESGYILEGIPRTPTPAYQRVLLYVDAATRQVRRVMIIDAQGNRNRFDFVEPVVNETPPKDEFAFTPPRGTQVIKP